MGIVSWARRKVQDFAGEGSGTASKDAEAGIRSPKPYAAYFSNGLFQGEDGSMWLYFKMPEDVKVEYTETYSEAADTQSYLTNIFNSLGQSIFDDSEKTRKDTRIKFHIPMVREIVNEIQQFDDITPAHADFLRRMNVSQRQAWHSYFGVELQMGNINADIYKVTDRVRNYVDFMMGKVDFEYNLYKESINLVTAVCMDNGMRPLDLTAHPEDFERLTAWYGVPDERYSMRPELTNTAIQVPEHGKSLFVPNYNEISFSAIRPRESRDMFTQDPFNVADVRFGKALLAPNVNSVHINIRGEIRSPTAALNMFDQKADRSTHKLEGSHDENSSSADRREAMRRSEQAEIAVAAANMRYAFLDNVEIIVANIVTGRKNELNARLQPYNLEAVNTVMRQRFAINSTIPTYPNAVFKVPAGNSKRNPNVNTFYGGVLALSGLFASTKPAGRSGILVGLSDANFEFKEIYTETDAASRYKKPPLIMVTGMTRSGKTVQMLMMMAQVVYMGQSAVFLNPKPQSSLKPFFDHLDGVTINMNRHYLEENPGMLDPMFFLEDREEVGNLLADMIIRAQGMNSKTNEQVKNVRSQVELRTQLVEHAKMPANECSYDVIFGNQRHGANSPRIDDDETLEFIRQNMISSPFWKASISTNPDGRSEFLEKIKGGKPFLVEWDNSMTMPQSFDEDRWTQPEKDSVQSVVNLFRFGAEIIGNSRRGGLLVVDEAHIMKTSEVVMNMLKKSGREWAAQDINLMLATQNLSDFLADDEYNIRPYVRMFIIMKVPEQKRELDIFFDLTKFPRDEQHTYYITHAGINEADSVKTKKTIPNAIVIDTAYDWKGGIMAGPWPARELAAASGKNIREITEEQSNQPRAMTYEEIAASIDDSREEAQYSDI